MKPSHPNAKAMLILAIEPVTAEGARNRPKWVWVVQQLAFNRSGTKLEAQSGQVELSSKAQALQIVRERVGACIAQDVELRVDFTDTTGEFESKTYHINGTTEQHREPAEGVPPARCSPLPMTSAEMGLRRDVAKPTKPPGQRPARRQRPAPEVPPVLAMVEAPTPAPVYVQPAPTYVQPAPVYVEPAPVMVEAPAPVAAPMAQPDPIVVAFADAYTAGGFDGAVSYVMAMPGQARAALAGKMRRGDTPADVREVFKAVMDSIKQQAAAPQEASLITQFLAEARKSGNDLAHLHMWLKGLSIPDRRGIGGLMASKASPEVRALYNAAKEYRAETTTPPAPVPAPAPAPTPAPAPVVRPPVSAAPAAPSKFDAMLLDYRTAVADGRGASFLAGLIPVVRANFRKHIAKVAPSFLPQFDADVPARPVQAPVSVPVAPIVIEEPPPPVVTVAPPVVVAPAPAPVVVAPAPVAAPAPAPAPAGGMDMAALIATLNGALGKIESSVLSGHGGESLRTRRYR